MLKDYVVRYDRGWDILCDPYEVKQGDWVLKIFRQKGEIAHEDFREFIGIFARLNPHVKDIDRLRPGEVVDIPLKKLSEGNFPGQSSGVVTIPFVMISNPMKLIEKHTSTYTIKSGDTVSQLIARQFGGRYGNITYTQGLKLLQAMNPEIKDINRIYAGQKIRMPDPSVRQQQWYAELFDEKGNLTKKPSSEQPNQTPGVHLAGTNRNQASFKDSAKQKEPPQTEAAAAMGGRLIDKGTYYLPMKKGADFELDLSRYPMIDMQNGLKVILTDKDKIMNVDLPLIQSYWNDVKAIKIPQNASSSQILEAVLSAVDDGQTTHRLAFDDGAASIGVTAKWIQSTLPRHTCITPVSTPNQRTHELIVRYLDQNDIVIRDICNTCDGLSSAIDSSVIENSVRQIDGGDQRTMVAAFAKAMSFNYSPNISVSFPYAGIQVEARSNLLTMEKGKEFLVDFGDLYGDAIKAIKKTGMRIIQVDASKKPLDTLQNLMQSMKLDHRRSPVFYGANRPSKFNTAIAIDGILIINNRGEQLLFTDRHLPELIARFIGEQKIWIFRIDTASN